MRRSYKGTGNPRYGSSKYTELEAILNDQIIDWYKYKLFRTEVLVRDNYTCRDCGLKKKSNHLHHLKPRKLFPKLCFVKSNVVTLCKSCHSKEENKHNFSYSKHKVDCICSFCKAKRGEFKPNYIDGRSKATHKCLDCDNLIRLCRIRCKGCNNKHLSVANSGTNNPNYKGIIRLCSDCDKKITVGSKFGRCKSCGGKNRRNK